MQCTSPGCDETATFHLAYVAERKCSCEEHLCENHARARKVMHLANHEARRFSHEYVGTEHILLGLVKEGSGVAANVLKNLNLDLHRIRLEVEKLVQKGPDRVAMDRLAQTPRADKVIEYSMEEARKLNHNYVGSEHLLLGLLRAQDGVAAQVLMNLGLTLPRARNEILGLLQQPEQKDGGRDGSRVHGFSFALPFLLVVLIAGLAGTVWLLLSRAR